MAEDVKKNAFEFKTKQMAERAASSAVPGSSPVSGNSAQNRVLPPAKKPSDLTKYFHCSHKSLVILDQNDQKVKFENHFFTTEDPALAKHIRDNYVNKKGGSLVFQEVNHFYYDQSHIIRPEILPLPPQESLFPADPQPLDPSLNKPMSDIGDPTAGQENPSVT